MSYSKYYSGGWQSGETGNTPITPDALNHIEDGIIELNGKKAPMQNASLVFGLGNNTSDTPESSTPRAEFRRSGNTTNGYALSIATVNSAGTKIYELVDNNANFCLPIYKTNLTTMASFYNAVTTYGALFFSCPASLWQALTNNASNFSCYGYAAADGTDVRYTISNSPGSMTYRGRLSNSTTIQALHYYGGTAVSS